ncbi:MAG: VOC family protein [Kordiimonadaceae bacterium]|nr:VOC family protein [Kordiimonadaceae bacterium]
MTEKDVVPLKMAHIVLKTKDRERLKSWYETVFHTTELFQNEFLTFLTYDDEHHRFAIAQLPPDSPDLDSRSVGVAHWAYSFATMGELVATYERLKAAGIEPYFPVNHGMTISMYYRDPDGNEIEFQVDRYESPEDCKACFDTDAFSKNPIGNPFNPDVFSAEIKSGASTDDAIVKAEAATA